MQKLLKYINSLPDHERDSFADRCGTTVGYLRKAISTKQKLGEILCLRIELESRDAVTLLDIRPDLAKTLATACYVRPKPEMRNYILKDRAEAEA